MEKKRDKLAGRKQIEEAEEIAARKFESKRKARRREFAKLYNEMHYCVSASWELKIFCIACADRNPK